MKKDKDRIRINKDLARQVLEGKISVYEQFVRKPYLQTNRDFYFNNIENQIILLSKENLRSDLLARDTLESNSDISKSLISLDKYDNVVKANQVLRIVMPIGFISYYVYQAYISIDQYSKYLNGTMAVISMSLFRDNIIDTNWVLKKAVKHYNKSFE